MKCSICDKENSSYIYGNWHCGSCESAIRKTIGKYTEEDMVNMFVDDSDDVVHLSVDTSDYSLCDTD